MCRGIVASKTGGPFFDRQCQRTGFMTQMPGSACLSLEYLQKCMNMAKLKNELASEDSQEGTSGTTVPQVRRHSVGSNCVIIPKVPTRSIMTQTEDVVTDLNQNIGAINIKDKCLNCQSQETQTERVVTEVEKTDVKNFQKTHVKDTSPETKSLAPSNQFNSNRDFKRINSAIQMLRTSQWFYENIGRHEAKALLKRSDVAVGTFFIRNSSDPNYLFALSIRTSRGITSVRIEYNNGKFRLDCEDALSNQMPKFDCVIQLVEFYIRLSKYEKKHQCVWLESSGRRDVPVKLTKPRLHTVPSLQHLCRLEINQKVNSACADTEKLPLPSPMKTFLKEYPYQH